MFYSIKIKKRKRFYLASFLDVSQEMICFLIQKRFFMKHIWAQFENLGELVKNTIFVA